MSKLVSQRKSDLESHTQSSLQKNKNRGQGGGKVNGSCV